MPAGSASPPVPIFTTPREDAHRDYVHRIVDVNFKARYPQYTGWLPYLVEIFNDSCRAAVTVTFDAPEQEHGISALKINVYDEVTWDKFDRETKYLDSAHDSQDVTENEIAVTLYSPTPRLLTVNFERLAEDTCQCFYNNYSCRFRCASLNTSSFQLIRQRCYTGGFGGAAAGSVGLVIFISVTAVLFVAVVTTFAALVIVVRKYVRKKHTSADDISVPPNWAEDLMSRSDKNLQQVFATDSISQYVNNRSQVTTTTLKSGDVIDTLTDASKALHTTDNAVSNSVVMGHSVYSRASKASEALATASQASEALIRALETSDRHTSNDDTNVGDGGAVDVLNGENSAQLSGKTSNTQSTEMRNEPETETLASCRDADTISNCGSSLPQTITQTVALGQPKL